MADADTVPEARIYAGDTHGRLLRIFTREAKPESLTVEGLRYGPAAACQDMSVGVVLDTGKMSTRIVRIQRAFALD